MAVICRFLAVICVPGGYLVLGVLLSCSGQLKMYEFAAIKLPRNKSPGSGGAGDKNQVWF